MINSYYKLKYLALIKIRLMAQVYTFLSTCGHRHKKFGYPSHKASCKAIVASYYRLSEGFRIITYTVVVGFKTSEYGTVICIKLDNLIQFKQIKRTELFRDLHLTSTVSNSSTHKEWDDYLHATWHCPLIQTSHTHYPQP